MVRLARGRLATIAGLLGAATGVFALVGWAIGLDWPTRILPGQPVMMPLTAVGIAASGIAVALLDLEGRAGLIGRRLARGLGVLVALIGLAVLAQYIAQQDLGIDRLLLFDEARERVATSPGRPSPHTATAFAMVGVAIFLSASGPGRFVAVTDVLCFLAAGIPYAAIVGYASGAPEFNRISPSIGMSLPTALALIAILVGIVSTRGDMGIAAMLGARTTGGLMLRRLLPPALVVPPILAVLRVMGQRAGLYDTPVGIGIMTLAITGIGLVALFVMSRALNRVESAYRRKSEQVQRSEALLRAILDSTPDAIYLKDRHGHYLMMNRAGAEQLDRSPGEFVGRTASQVFSPEIARVFRFNELNVLQSGTPFTYEDKIVEPTGRERTFLTVVSPFRFDGDIVGVVGVSRDISERHEAEAAVRANEAKYRALLEAAPDAVFVLDIEARIVITNSQAERMFGYTRHEMLGRPLEMLVPGGDIARRVHDISDQNREDSAPPVALEADLKGRRRDGSQIDVEINLSPARVGEDVSITAIVRDVTERIRIQAEVARHQAEIQAAREAAQLKEFFLSSMSHEMKTPLSLIVGYAELLEDKQPGDPLVEGILEGTRRLMHHIDSLLTYSALLSGALPLYKADTCVEEVVRDAAAIVEPAIRARNQHLDCKMDPKTPCLVADSRRLSQVIQALLENASRFTAPGGNIQVRVKGRPDSIEISVKDNGIGMSEQELSRIWEPFGQAKVGDTERTGGLGLGLKIARKLAELHGGTISVLSRPGEGTTVTVILPTANQSVERNAAAVTESRTDAGTSGIAPGRKAT